MRCAELSFDSNANRRGPGWQGDDGNARQKEREREASQTRLAKWRPQRRRLDPPKTRRCFSLTLSRSHALTLSPTPAPTKRARRPIRHAHHSIRGPSEHPFLGHTARPWFPASLAVHTLRMPSWRWNPFLQVDAIQHSLQLGSHRPLSPRSSVSIQLVSVGSLPLPHHSPTSAFALLRFGSDPSLVSFQHRH